MTEFELWNPSDAAHHISVPTEASDKYSRGVLGVITGSDQYPGAAVLGVEAAMRTGVGMVRYLGGERASTLVLQRRPETVTGNGRVQAWLIGSGTDHESKEADAEAAIETAIGQSLPVVLDGGALERVRQVTSPTIITPHAGELARLLGVDRDSITADPGHWAAKASQEFGCTVLLKGHTSYIVGGGAAFTAASAPPWTATAGSGDALAGILGALVATHTARLGAGGSLMARIGATASVIHGLAAQRASQGGPFTVLDLISHVPSVVTELLSLRSSGRR